MKPTPEQVDAIAVDVNAFLADEDGKHAPSDLVRMIHGRMTTLEMETERLPTMTSAKDRAEARSIVRDEGAAVIARVMQLLVEVGAVPAPTTVKLPPKVDTKVLRFDEKKITGKVDERQQIILDKLRVWCRTMPKDIPAGYGLMMRVGVVYIGDAGRGRVDRNIVQVDFVLAGLSMDVVVETFITVVEANMMTRAEFFERIVRRTVNQMINDDMSRVINAVRPA